MMLSIGFFFGFVAGCVFARYWLFDLEIRAYEDRSTGPTNHLEK